MPYRCFSCSRANYNSSYRNGWAASLLILIRIKLSHIKQVPSMIILRYWIISCTDYYLVNLFFRIIPCYWALWEKEAAAGWRNVNDSLRQRFGIVPLETRECIHSCPSSLTQHFLMVSSCFIVVVRKKKMMLNLGQKRRNLVRNKNFEVCLPHIKQLCTSKRN